MDEKIQEFRECFPLNIHRDEYFALHLLHLIKCIKEELYVSAYLHLHILYMLFVYIHILRISKKRTEEFKLYWTRLPDKDKRFKGDSDSPFCFSLISEKNVFSFFKIVKFDRRTIGNLSSVVNKRNAHFHASGEIHLRDEGEFELEFDSYLKKMMMIVKKQIPFLEEFYASRIKQYKKGFVMTSDEIESNFINSEDSFSLQELNLLSNNKRDIVSKFIIDKPKQKLDHYLTPLSALTIS